MRNRQVENLPPHVSWQNCRQEEAAREGYFGCTILGRRLQGGDERGNLTLQRNRSKAINSPPRFMASDEEVIDLEPAHVHADSVDEASSATIHRWVRIALVLLTVPWILVFYVAIFLIDPYQGGEAAR